ncbi:hypothetical protein [Polyangium sp. 15x6]|uniref:hypothetical protein n=1 Tax=Polyangium sp. 15x6 TaxID=3042687 RepID=UPI00249C94CE|nr:hypothetical protein [Polyangium sp. 15x6]MDI3287357.1 hypothetical protein [Polyangium sp. 15x6]
MGCLLAPRAQATVVVPHRLVYEAPKECPDERALRNSIIERIGRDPFDANDPKTLSVRIERAEHGFRATIVTTKGESIRTRTLESPISRCTDIFKDVDFVVGSIVEPILIDLPVREAVPPAPSASPPPAPPPPPAPTPSAALPAATRSSHGSSKADAPGAPLRGEIFAGFSIAGLATPGPVALGATVGGGLRAGLWTFGVEVRGLADVPGSTEAIPADVSLWTGGLFACAFRPLSVCLALTGGVYQAAPEDNVRMRLTRAPFVAPAFRLAYEFPILRGISGRAQLDVAIPVTQALLVDRGQFTWSSDPVLLTGTLLVLKPF